MTAVKIAAVQMTCGPKADANIAKAEAFVREAAGQGARIVMLQELFANLYFPQAMKHERYALAQPAEGHPMLARFQALAAELGVVLPVPFYERAGNALFNSVMVIDADGRRAGVYRKSHIPHAPGYEEKYYFSPGDTGFQVWPTRYGTLGVGICWDQWFPEAARAMAMKGADLLVYPTAIGADPSGQEPDSSGAWQRVMQGHAAANAIHVMAANRIGREDDEGSAIDFYGSSFIADHTGAKLAEAGTREGVILAEADFDRARAHRERWSFFRDRRPDLYGVLMGLDGRTRPAA